MEVVVVVAAVVVAVSLVAVIAALMRLAMLYSVCGTSEKRPVRSPSTASPSRMRWIRAAIERSERSGSG